MKVKKMNEVNCYLADEHKKDARNYYGYLTIEHPELGEFTISVSIDGKDIRTDGYPWNFLQEEEYILNPSQIEFVNENKKIIGRYVKTDTPTFKI